ncbi:MAG: hypothetical protein M3442_03715 [Chloroflexota bacterium]|nr:hypothetical protein [Chloroflexota bacterium]
MDQRQATAAEQPQAPSKVHPHPIRWDAEQQLWVCTVGCGFSRLKRESEVVPSREEARQEAQRAGTGVDFADLVDRNPADQAAQVGQETPSTSQPAPAEPSE